MAKLTKYAGVILNRFEKFTGTETIKLKQRHKRTTIINCKRGLN